jgi:hypothetical protein
VLRPTHFLFILLCFVLTLRGFSKVCFCHQIPLKTNVLYLYYCLLGKRVIVIYFLLSLVIISKDPKEWIFFLSLNILLPIQNNHGVKSESPSFPARCFKSFLLPKSSAFFLKQSCGLHFSWVFHFSRYEVRVRYWWLLLLHWILFSLFVKWENWIVTRVDSVIVRNLRKIVASWQFLG